MLEYAVVPNQPFFEAGLTILEKLATCHKLWRAEDAHVSIALQKLFFGDRAFCQLSLTWRQSAGYDKELDFKQAYMALMWICGLRPAINETEAGFVHAAFGDDEDEGIEFDWNVNLAVYVEYGEWFAENHGFYDALTNPNYVERPIGEVDGEAVEAPQITAKDVYELIRAGAEHVQKRSIALTLVTRPWYPGLKTADAVHQNITCGRYITGK
ncbi:hypothetical protein SPFM10_00081 [Salmonella phage SPFM10]|nr:hypothetical protein SPFM10_00081 [Salmonella phage SPFM10]